MIEFDHEAIAGVAWFKVSKALPAQAAGQEQVGPHKSWLTAELNQERDFGEILAPTLCLSLSLPWRQSCFLAVTYTVSQTYHPKVCHHSKQQSAHGNCHSCLIVITTSMC